MGNAAEISHDNDRGFGTGKSFSAEGRNVTGSVVVYAETSHLYSRRYGHPPIAPVAIVKYLLVGFLYGIPSERQIEERCAGSNAFRWYIGIDLDEQVPDHSTIFQLRRRKPSFRRVFRRLFEQIVRQCVEKGLVSGKLMATDSTHVKANASLASEYLVEIQEESGAYWERLDAMRRKGGRIGAADRKTPEEAGEAGQTGQAQDIQTGEPHGPGGRPHEAS